MDRHKQDSALQTARVELHCGLAKGETPPGAWIEHSRLSADGGDLSTPSLLKNWLVAEKGFPNYCRDLRLGIVSSRYSLWELDVLVDDDPILAADADESMSDDILDMFSRDKKNATGISSDQKAPMPLHLRFCTPERHHMWNNPTHVTAKITNVSVAPKTRTLTVELSKGHFFKFLY